MIGTKQRIDQLRITTNSYLQFMEIGLSLAFILTTKRGSHIIVKILTKFY